MRERELLLIFLIVLFIIVTVLVITGKISGDDKDLTNALAEFATKCKSRGGHIPTGTVVICLTNDGRIIELDK